MTDLATELFRVHDVRRIEAQAMALPGHDDWTLMQRAGAAALACVRTRWPLAQRLAVVCGSGNNGGDGYVVATLAYAAGMQVAVLRIGARPTREPAARAWAQWHAAAGDVDIDHAHALASADVVVDALFGIGLDRAPEGIHADAIAAINASGRPVIALDVPSGLNADTGHAPGCCVRAAATMSFIAWKRGLWTGAAAEACGERQLASLDLPLAAFADISADARCMTRASLASALPPRARDAHKGHAGQVLVVGGDFGFGGAAVIVARAALRAGAGLVSVATRPEHVSALLAQQPEMMAHGVASADALDDLIERADVIALGPGLGQGEWSVALARRACASGKPLVLDADALNLLAARRIEARGECVLTPHPGEASRLLEATVAEVMHDRYTSVRALAAKYRSTVVLKGAGSLIADASGRVFVCPFGNPGMASGGMGDALTGVIAAFRAQGLDATTAARTGVLAHALAGDRAAQAGERGLLASDVIAELRNVVNP